MLAESVGLALLVVLERLTPAERVAFVLHDVFAVPFDDISVIVGRSTDAARKLASRARRRVQGSPTVSASELLRQRDVIDAFLAASQTADFEGLLAVLDPDVELSADREAVEAGAAGDIHGAAGVAAALAGRAAMARPALIDGSVGVVVAPQGHLFLAIQVSIAQGKIVRIHAIADPAHLGQLDIAVIDD